MTIVCVAAAAILACSARFRTLSVLLTTPLLMYCQCSAISALDSFTDESIRAPIRPNWPVIASIERPILPRFAISNSEFLTGSIPDVASCIVAVFNCS